MPYNLPPETQKQRNKPINHSSPFAASLRERDTPLKQNKIFPAALAAGALALLLALTGCAPRVLTSPSASGRTPFDWPQPDTGEDAPDDWYDDWYGQWYDDSGLTEAQRMYGSAGLLGWPSVLVSVYLDEAGGGASWSEADIARSRETLATAVDWIEQQCSQYGLTASISYDDGTPDNGLFYHVSYDGRFAGGTDSQESDAFYAAAYDLCEGLDTDELRSRYGTSSIGFLLFLPVRGSSFTMVHYLEDGADYYQEFSCLYRIDAYSGPEDFETPAVYAHEILHLYGAPDLYEGSSDYYVTPELTRYVQSQWPDAIMLDTYGPDGSLIYGAVEKQISPLTAARLGLCSGFAGQESFPAVCETPPGVFSTGELAGQVQLPGGTVAARPGA